MDSSFWQKFDELKQAHKRGEVVGLRKVADVAPRLDIDVLLDKEPKTFNLFLLALKELQEDKGDDIMGYFQIAGTEDHYSVSLLAHSS